MVCVFFHFYPSDSGALPPTVHWIFSLLFVFSLLCHIRHCFIGALTYDCDNVNAYSTVTQPTSSLFTLILLMSLLWTISHICDIFHSVVLKGHYTLALIDACN